MFKHLFHAYRFLTYPVRAFSWRTELLRNFILPNFSRIMLRKVRYVSPLRCAQRTVISGDGEVSIGSHCRFGNKLGGFFRNGYSELQTRSESACIRIGNHLSTNNNLFVCSSGSISIGNNCLIGQYVIIMDFEAHGILPQDRDNVGYIGSVVINDNVWIGNNVTILKDSVIGRNSIVATGAVVSGEFPDNVILGGIPARVIKKIETTPST